MAFAENPIGAVLYNETRLDKITNHLDLPTVKSLATYQNMTKMGMRDLWAYTHMEEVPFMYANLMANNVEYIKGDVYQFELPTAAGDSARVVSVQATDNTRIGYGGEPFKLTVKGMFLGGYGANIMFDMTSPYVMEVVEFQKKGEHIQYDVVYKGSRTKEDFIPRHLFQAGSQLYKINATRSPEFGQKYDSWSAGSTIGRDYLGFLTTAEIQTHYHMTDQACKFFDQHELTHAQNFMDALDEVVEYVALKSPVQTGIRDFKQYMANGGEAKNISGKVVAMKYDDVCMQILNRQNMNTVIWHPGSAVGTDGFDQSYIAPGIWHQIDDSGYKRFFNIETLSKDHIYSAIQEFEAGKIRPLNYGETRVYRIRTGRGGRQLLNQIFADELKNVTGLIDAIQMGQIGGTNKSGIDITLPWYKSIDVPGLGKLMIDEDPSFDNNMTNDIINPKLSTGFRLTSYSMIIEDYNTSSSNLKILRNENSKGKNLVRMTVVNGNRSHPLFEQQYNGATVHEGASLQTGFGAYFRTTPDTGYVVDPTKILKLIPKNPYNPNGNSL